MAAYQIQPAASASEIQPAITEFMRQVGYLTFVTKKQRITQLDELGEQHQEPADGCEIYFSNFPLNCFEDRLFPLFNRYGRILQMRLMIENEVSLRGYGYVVYELKACAEQAVYKLNGKLLDTLTMKVCMSFNCKRLYITGLPNRYKTKDIESLILNSVKGVTNLTFFRSKDAAGNSAYCYLTFKSHELAIKSKHILYHYLSREMNTLVRVCWAKPEFVDTPGEEIKTMFVRGLAAKFLDKKIILNMLTSVVDKKEILKVKTKRYFSFITFKSRTATEAAIAALNGKIVCGQRLEATLANSRKSKIVPSLTHSKLGPFPLLCD